MCDLCREGINVPVVSKEFGNAGDCRYNIYWEVEHRQRVGEWSNSWWSAAEGSKALIWYSIRS